MTDKITVLVVDDSAFARSVIIKKLATDPGIEVIDFARDGVEAVEKVKRLHPNVVTMDVSMPRMDGLEALQQIMAENPTPVVMLSALTGPQTQTTIEALERGAVDFFLKPSVTNPTGESEATSDLIQTLKTASTISGDRLRNMANWNRKKNLSKQSPPQSNEQPPESPKPAASKSSSLMKKVVVIGASTGGPRALADLIPQLPANLPAAVLLVQHMPATFTKSLAERLNSTSSIEVKEAQEGDFIRPGLVLMAPGDYHMTVSPQGQIKLNQGPPECGVRPAVNITMDSVAQVYGPATVAAVLTGMGTDGTRGATLMQAAGGVIIVEDESTCAIYGMPKSIVDAGKADKILPLHKIAEEIVNMCWVGKFVKIGAGV